MAGRVGRSVLVVVFVNGRPGIRKHRRELFCLFMVRFLLLDIEIVGGLRTRLRDEWFMFVRMFVVCGSAREETKHGGSGAGGTSTRTEGRRAMRTG